MTTIDINATLADLVTANPILAAPLGRLGLDYCCGGQRLFTEAVAAAGLDLQQAMTELVSAAQLASTTEDLNHRWSTMDGVELVDHLESTHHAYLKQALPYLAELAAKVAGVHSVAHPEVVAVHHLVTELRADLEPHLMKEERVLFPMIRELAAATHAPTFHCGSVANPIQAMWDEHDRTGEILAQLRATTNGFLAPAGACGSYLALYSGLAELESDTHLHVHKENNVLFPMALAAESGLKSS